MKIKKIIAREGLVILILLAVSIVSFILAEALASLFPTTPYYICEVFKNFGWLLIPLGYPAYLLIRFIIWAVKTIKIPSINIENKLSVKTNLSGIQNNVAENMEKIADDMVIGSNKKTNIITIYNTTQNFYLNAGGYTIAEEKIPEIAERAKEVVLGSAEALKKTPEEKVKSIFYDLQALYDTSALASGTSTGAIIRNAGYIFKGEGYPAFEVKFIPPSPNANVFDINIPPEHKEK